MSQQEDDFLAELESQHYAKIEFSLADEQLVGAANCFLRFLQLPDDIKRELHFPARVARASADGYTDKSQSDAKDAKQFFHWSRTLMTSPTCQRLSQEQPEVAEFFSAAESIYVAVEHALNPVFTHQLPAYRQHIFSGDKLVDGILRFLCYTPGPEQSFSARAHFDKGFSTLAIADSAPGLRIGCCDRHPLKSVNHESGTALFMPAWMLFQASNGLIKPAWHDVVNLPDQKIVNSHCARWSIVFFINDPHSPFSSWDTLHTPLH